MGTPHNEALAGDFAKTVLMPGDPLRARFIAETFLEAPRLVNNVRGVQGYTGTYQGTPVSVMASGMGAPSMGIYSYELYHFYDVETIIRVGSAGAISPKLHLRDVVMAQGACTDSYYAKQYGLPGTFAPIADFTLLEVEMETASLYCNAAEAGRRALAICTISDSLVTGEKLPALERQTSFRQMIEIALATAVAMDKR